VWLVHGEPEGSEALAAAMGEAFPGSSVTVATQGMTVEL